MVIAAFLAGCLWFGTGCDTPPEPVIDYRELVWCLAYPQHCQESHEDAPYRPEPAVGLSDTVYQGMGSNWEQWRPLVASYFPAGEVDRAVCVIEHESGGNTWAYNPSTATGIFQVKATLWGGFGDLTDPEVNTIAAHYIWQTYGWTQWSVYNDGKCP